MTDYIWEEEGGALPKSLAVEENPLEWDADSTEGADVDPQHLPDYEPTLFTAVPGKEIIDA